MIRTSITTHSDGWTRIESSYADGRVESRGGSAARPARFEYGAGPLGESTKEIRIGDNGEETEWTRSWSDAAGRAVLVEYPDGSALRRNTMAAASS